MSGVIVIGGANLDIKARVSGQHIAHTSNPGETRFFVGGVGRNVAHNLATLGVQVSLITAVGADDAGDTVVAATEQAGVGVSMVLRVPQRTGTYVAVLDQAGELVTAVNDMAIMDAITPAYIADKMDAICQADLVIADCNLRADVLEVIASEAAHKLLVEPVSVPKAAKLASLQGRYDIYLATPNRDQFSAIGGTMMAVEKMVRPGRLQNLVIHQGQAGALVLSADGNHQVPALPQAHVADVTGAGDAAVAGLAFGLMSGYDLVTAARCGQAAASLKLASLQSTPERLTADAIKRMVFHEQ